MLEQTKKNYDKRLIIFSQVQQHFRRRHKHDCDRPRGAVRRRCLQVPAERRHERVENEADEPGGQQ